MNGMPVFKNNRRQDFLQQAEIIQTDAEIQLAFRSDQQMLKIAVARAFADAEKGGVGVFCAGTETLNGVGNRHAQIVVGVNLQIDAGGNLVDAGLDGAGRHDSDRVGNPQGGCSKFFCGLGEADDKIVIRPGGILQTDG